MQGLKPHTPNSWVLRPRACGGLKPLPVIYALIDPRDNTVRYVGVTEDVYAQFQQHINCAAANYAKNAWIHELRAANKMVIMETLEEVEDRERALEREGYWITHFEMLREP